MSFVGLGKPWAQKQFLRKHTAMQAPSSSPQQCWQSPGSLQEDPGALPPLLWLPHSISLLGGHRSAPSLPCLSFAGALPMQGQGVRAPGGFATRTAPSGAPLPLPGAGIAADQPLLRCSAARGQPPRLPHNGHPHELPGSPHYIFHLARVTFFSPPVCCLPEMV